MSKSVRKKGKSNFSSAVDIILQTYSKSSLISINISKILFLVKETVEQSDLSIFTFFKERFRLSRNHDIKIFLKIILENKRSSL